MAEFILGLMFGILKLAQDTIYFKDEILLISLMQASLLGLISILKKGTPYFGAAGALSVRSFSLDWVLIDSTHQSVVIILVLSIWSDQIAFLNANQKFKVS